jgi:hypothetical protein
MSCECYFASKSFLRSVMQVQCLGLFGITLLGPTFTRQLGMKSPCKELASKILWEAWCLSLKRSCTRASCFLICKAWKGPEGVSKWSTCQGKPPFHLPRAFRTKGKRCWPLNQACEKRLRINTQSRFVWRGNSWPSLVYITASQIDKLWMEPRSLYFEPILEETGSVFRNL